VILDKPIHSHIEISKIMSKFLYDNQNFKNDEIYGLLRFLLIGSASGP